MQKWSPNHLMDLGYARVLLYSCFILFEKCTSPHCCVGFHFYEALGYVTKAKLKALIHSSFDEPCLARIKLLQKIFQWQHLLQSVDSRTNLHLLNFWLTAGKSKHLYLKKKGCAEMYLTCKGCEIRYTANTFGSTLACLISYKICVTCTRMTSLTLTLKSLVKIVTIQMVVRARYKLGKEWLINIEEIDYYTLWNVLNVFLLELLNIITAFHWNNLQNCIKNIWV